MREMYRPTQPELTMNSNPPTLEGKGNIFMPEPGNGEQPPKPEVKPNAPKPDQPQQRAEARPVSPEDAEKAWRQHYEKQGVDFDSLSIAEKRTINLAIQEGRVPKKPSREEIGEFLKGLSEQPEFEEATRAKAESIPEQEAVGRRRGEAGGVAVYGMADTLRMASYRDPILRNLIRELNAEVNRVGVGKPLHYRFIEEQLNRVRGLLDQGLVDAAQANRLLGELNTWMAEAIAGEEGRIGRYLNARDERLIMTNVEERERIFEEVFIAVDANPGVQFDRALSLEASGKLDNFFTVLSHARIYDADGITDITDDPGRQAEVSRKRGQLFREFSGKQSIRRALHNANWSVSEGGGDIQIFGQEMATFPSEQIDLIFEDPLVGTAMRMFEQAFQQIKAENKGQLPYEELAWNYKTKSSKLEDKVWDLMRENIRTGLSPNVPDEWRLRRAIILARGFGVISLRFPEIAAQARLPEESPLATSTERASRIGSIYGEAIARYLDPIEHIIEKFGIGEEDRAFLYYFLTGEKGRFQSKEQLQQALKMASHLVGKDKRLIDIINIFRIGGGFSQSSWRQFMIMKGFPEDEQRRSGIGIREGRVSYDVDDDIREEVKREYNVAGRSEEEIPAEVKEKIKAEFEKRKTSGKDARVFEKRLKMWQDALKANPLRVMWQWEEKEPGQRARILSEALGVSEDEAKNILPEVEKDLIIIQENTVQALGRGDASYNDAEMLNYGVIGGANPTAEDLTRRQNVQRYVEKIREKASANNYVFIKSLFETPFIGTSAEHRSPFPYIIGFEDIPFSDFNFINSGGRAFARRINDFGAAVTASNELINLITMIPKIHDVGPLIESLDKIKQAVSQYDKSIAMEVVPFLAEGIIRTYDKGIEARLPLGIGTIVGLISDTSYAQTLWGRDAMTWDEGDKFNFTRHLFGLLKKEDIARIRKRVGATHLNFAVDILRTYGQLALLLLLYNFAKQVSSEGKS